MSEERHQQRAHGAESDQPERDLRVYDPCRTLVLKSKTVLGECYLLPAPLGLRPDSYDGMRRFLTSLVSHFVTRSGCFHQSFVALFQARSRETNELFADCAPRWQPETVLGVWTHLPAPRMMTKEAFMELDPTSPSSATSMRVHNLFQIATDAHACLEAMETMTGTGTGIQIVSQVEPEIVLRNLKDLFLDFIKERIYRIFPWYIPLLSMKSLEDPIASLAERAMVNIPLYIRESPEDGGLLVLSREPLWDVLLAIGCEPEDFNDEGKLWMLPDEWLQERL